MSQALQEKQAEPQQEETEAPATSSIADQPNKPTQQRRARWDVGPSGGPAAAVAEQPPSLVPQPILATAPTTTLQHQPVQKVASHAAPLQPAATQIQSLSDKVQSKSIDPTIIATEPTPMDISTSPAAPVVPEPLTQTVQESPTNTQPVIEKKPIEVKSILLSQRALVEVFSCIFWQIAKKALATRYFSNVLPMI